MVQYRTLTEEEPITQQAEPQQNTTHFYATLYRKSAVRVYTTQQDILSYAVKLTLYHQTIVNEISSPNTQCKYCVVTYQS